MLVWVFLFDVSNQLSLLCPFISYELFDGLVIYTIQYRVKNGHALYQKYHLLMTVKLKTAEISTMRLWRLFLPLRRSSVHIS